MSTVSDQVLDTVADGSYHAPHDVLGPHRMGRALARHGSL